MAIVHRAPSSYMRQLRKAIRTSPKAFWGCFTILLLLLALKLYLALTVSIPSPTRKPSNPSSVSPVTFQSDNYTPNRYQSDVIHATRAIFQSYWAACPGRDEFNPFTDHCHDWFNVGLTVLDSLDTLLLMGLHQEYDQSRSWAAESLNMSAIHGRTSSFELIIRALAGLLSAYEITGDDLWIKRAADLGEIVLPVSHATKTGCLPQDTYVGSAFLERKSNYASYSTPADAGSLQLELRTLSRLTGDSRFAEAGDKCINSMLRNLPASGLVPPGYDVDSGTYSGNRQSIGGSVDSFYEMMLKNWVAFGKRDTDAHLLKHYEEMVETVFKDLSGVSPSGLTYIGEKYGSEKLRAQMDHLVCFLPGTMALAALQGLGGGVHGHKETDYLPRARKLARSCVEMTRCMDHGLAGEITSFAEEQSKPMKNSDHCYLRPEIVEALYYLDLVDPQGGDTYKAWGREMWDHMRKSAQVPGKRDGVMGSWTNLLDGNGKVPGRDKLHSFVLAETVKYFYLLFDERNMEDSQFALNRWIMNTEAHPFRIVK